MAELDGAAGWRGRLAAGDMLDVIPLAPAHESQDAPEPDDAANAIGKRIARIDVEADQATVYLTFEDGSYLTYAARLDDEGVLLLDRFCEPAARYEDYWVFDDLAGECGAPPPESMPQPGSPFDPHTWSEAAGSTVYDLGWYEEGMQVFVHFEEGGYLTLAAQASGGSAYLLGYFGVEDPQTDDDYVIFVAPEEA
jgi:hypothetical protein